MDSVLGGGMERFPNKPQTIDVFSESAVRIEEGGLDQIFASDEEDEEQEVCGVGVWGWCVLVCVMVCGVGVCGVGVWGWCV